METISNNCFRPLSDDELYSVDGGGFLGFLAAAGLFVAAVVVVCAVVVLAGEAAKAIYDLCT